MSRILITIPTWNEAAVIGRNLHILKRNIAERLPAHDVTVEVADNGSTDGTREIVRGIDGVKLLEIAERGKGRAIRESWKAHPETADVVAFMDADLAADLSALPSLIDPIVSGRADLVCGSRFAPGARIERAWLREAASYAYRALQTMVLRLPVRDAQCGFKAMSASAARQVLPLSREHGWMFDTELLALAAERRFRVLEIPVAWIEHRDPARRSAISVFRDGWGFIQGLFRIKRSLRQ